MTLDSCTNQYGEDETIWDYKSLSPACGLGANNNKPKIMLLPLTRASSPQLPLSTTIPDRANADTLTKQFHIAVATPA